MNMGEFRLITTLFPSQLNAKCPNHPEFTLYIMYKYHSVYHSLIIDHHGVFRTAIILNLYNPIMLRHPSGKVN